MYTIYAYDLAIIYLFAAFLLFVKIAKLAVVVLASVLL